MGGAPQATVIAGGFKTSMQNAAYANGTMAHALDFDNTWYPLNHPTSPTLPAILAIAEHHRLPGSKSHRSHRHRVRSAGDGCGWRRPASKTGVGISQARHHRHFRRRRGGGKLLDLDRKQTLMAFGLAGSRAGSLSINTGTMTKSSHSGHAARMGVECGVLAKMGWTASADVFGPKGFFDTFLPGNAKPELLTEGFGAPFRMVDPGVGFKKHPCNYFTHRPIDAALALREEHRHRAGAHRARARSSSRASTTSTGRSRARASTASSACNTRPLVALLDGEVTVDSFTNERRFAARTWRRCCRRCSCRSTTRFRSISTACTPSSTSGSRTGGSSRSASTSSRAGSGFPLTREQRLKKFFACTRRVLEEKAANRMLELVERLEPLPDVTEIMDIARCDRAEA